MSVQPSSAAIAVVVWQAPGQAPGPIREQVVRDVEQALRDVGEVQRRAHDAAQAAAQDAAREAAQAAVAAGAAGAAAQGGGGEEIVTTVPALPPPPRRMVIRRNGQPITIETTGQPFPNGVPDIPPRVEEVALAFFFTVAAIFIGTPLARAFARRIDRRSAAPQGVTPDVTGRLDRIEQAVEAIAVEVERVSEGQRYVTKVLGEARALAAPNEAAANELRVVERATPERVR